MGLLKKTMQEIVSYRITLTLKVILASTVYSNSIHIYYSYNNTTLCPFAAMIKEVPPGESVINYQFVAAVSADPKKNPLPQLTFFKTKAISFPGGEKFKPLGECEIDPRADGCSPELDED